MPLDMPDLLLELFSEEIPARMQARAAEDLRKLVTDRLVAASLPYEGAKAFATPRRLARCSRCKGRKAARSSSSSEWGSFCLSNRYLFAP